MRELSPQMFQVDPVSIGLDGNEARELNLLLRVWSEHHGSNLRNRSYYRQEVRPKAANEATPSQVDAMNIVLGWPTKAVDVLMARSVFAGFSGTGDGAGELERVTESSDLKELYREAATSMLVGSCSFLTVSADPASGVVVSAHPAESAAATWDMRNRRVRTGLVVVDVDDDTMQTPTWVNLYLESVTCECRRLSSGSWEVNRLDNGIGRPLIEPLRFRPDLSRPFGRSRISPTVRSLTDRALETCLRTDTSAAFYTWPQRYLLNIDKKTGEQLKQKMVDAYANSIFMATYNRNGDAPVYGQLPQMSMQPHDDELQTLAKLFAGETGIPLNSLGIVFDNPSSAEAIQAGQDDLVNEATWMNRANGQAMRNVGLMALAQRRGKKVDELPADDLTICAEFEDEQHPSLSARSDFAMKVASVVPGYANTEHFWRDLGYTPEETKSVMEELREAQVQQRLADIFGELG